ncbi:MAG: 23S rRNA (pseudouridine(1915)-N(3))-methyltransferase RlmH [Campylobacteraceae bacterium]|jgi:23S rRNA (pseudouridine1915-N3)-methyltransferase|nr:23S rRNA (pseudouridine(1915)-N(3))-methyltransferase RlmH [Campylobacteraceae bacterium]
MKISIYSIEKSVSKEIKTVSDEFLKMSSKFAKIEDFSIFNNQIATAQTISANEAKSSYTKAYEPYFRDFTIALDVGGEVVDSYEFSNILKDRSSVKFFIGGAYGFEDCFLKKCNKVISLSSLTFAHKIAKLVLLEQIYRALCIQNNHPYHKN